MILLIKTTYKDIKFLLKFILKNVYTHDNVTASSNKQSNRLSNEDNQKADDEEHTKPVHFQWPSDHDVYDN